MKGLTGKIGKALLTLTFVFSAVPVLWAQGAAEQETSREEKDTLPAVSAPASGRMMWIPDSLAAGILSVMEGKSKIVRDRSHVDLNERVIVKGDTMPLIIKQKNFGRFSRGLLNYLFIPRGQWQFGLTASYGEFSSSDLQLFDILSDVNLSGNIFSIKPSVAFFVRNNISVGLQLNYTQAKADLGSLDFDVMDDMSFSLSDIGYKNESYSAAITCSQFIGITRNSRFGVFNEIALSFASGNSEFRRPYKGEPRTTHTTYMEARLSFSPGLCVFIMKNVSFNISFGVFGYYLRNEKQKLNGENLGNRFSSGANFKFNIFNINFGIGVHI